jgi:hypothetical protein
MIPTDQMNTPIETPKDRIEPRKGEVADVVHAVTRTNSIIPSTNESFVHLIYVRERAITIADDCRMSKMVICCPPDLAHLCTPHLLQTFSQGPESM